MGATRDTVELCGAAYQPADPGSVRCLVPKAAHQQLPHRAFGRDGEVIEWILSEASERELRSTSLTDADLAAAR